jgi:ABC-type polysaccharide/polyol phosphate export permease
VRQLATFWSQRRLLRELVRRDVRARFAGSRFGLLWSLINPLVQLVSYSVIFGYIYSATGQSRVGFVASLFCGLWPWWAFQEGTMRGLGAIVEQSALLKKIPLPPEVCVFSAVTASFCLQMLGFALFLAIFGSIGLTPISARWLLLPLIMLIGLALTAGMGLVLAPLYLVVRDTLHVASAVLTVWFFASPVLYDIQPLPERLRLVAAVNPLVGLIGLVRYAVLGAELPSAGALLACGLFVVGAWALGVLLLSRTEGLLDEYW